MTENKSTAKEFARAAGRSILQIGAIIVGLILMIGTAVAYKSSSVLRGKR